MGTVVVVVEHPLVELALGIRESREDPVGAELSADRPVESFDLARCRRRARLGMQVPDSVLAADAIEEHLDRRTPEPSGEDLAVIGQDLLRDP